jgi:hypothetical protein
VDEFAQELLKLGPAGLVCVVLWLMLYKSEQREAKKDTRIQLLENQLVESYDERIESAERIADALHSNANAMVSLTSEVRSRK